MVYNINDTQKVIKWLRNTPQRIKIIPNVRPTYSRGAETERWSDEYEY